MILSINRKQIELSLFDAQRAMERCEVDAGMSPTSTSPTIELLSRVMAWAKHQFDVTLTPTAAWQVWWAICELIARTRKAHERIADVSAWMHVDATKLTDDQLFGLFANLPRIKAQHVLQSGQYDALDYEGLYGLVLLATGSEKAAQDARTAALERYVDSRCGSGGN